MNKQDWQEFKGSFGNLLLTARLEKLYDHRYELDIELGRGVIKAKPEGTNWDYLLVFGSDTKLLHWSFTCLGFKFVEKGRITVRHE